MITSNVLLAQKKGFKLVETSNPKGKPEWVTSFRDGYIKVQTVEAATLTEAEDKVYNDLLGEIAKSVSSNIEVTVDHTTESIIMEKGITVTEYVETVKSEAVLKVAKMPDFQGISITNADKYYERYYCKKTGEEYYNYYLLYPFSRFELENLIQKYNANERAIMDRIVKDENVANDFYRTDDIENAIRDLDNLASELGSSDFRIPRIDSAKGMLKSIIKRITIEVTDNRRQKMIFRLVYDGRIIGSSSMPKLSSKCAQDFDCKKDGDDYVLKYDDAYCYYDNDYIKISFNLKGGTVCKNVYLK